MDADDTVEVFGDDSRMGSFMDRVRDPRTGEWLEYVGPDDDADGATFSSLSRAANAAGDTDLVLAVLDTGVVHEHPSLRSINVIDHDVTGEGPADLSGHGTMVTLIAIRGCAYRHVLNIKVADGVGEGRPEWLVEGMSWAARWAAEHPDSRVVANISAGIYRPAMGTHSHLPRRL